MSHTRKLILVTLLIISFYSCQEDEKLPVLENKSRIECERRSRFCNGRDAMRFYRSVPRIQQTDLGVTVTDVWSSFIVCCDVFERMMDSLTLYNDMLTEAASEGRPFERTCVIDSMITISTGLEYYNMMSPKRWQWLWFGDSTFHWPMPTGEYFQEHKEELEEAHARCCLL